MTVKDKDELLTIEVRRPGWRIGTLASLAVGVVLCVLWRQGGAGDSFLFTTVGLIAGLAAIAQLIDHVYKNWRLSIDAEVVRVECWALYTSEGWTCPRSAFVVGEVSIAVNRQGVSLFGAQRFIHLQVGGEDVRFMDGHRHDELAAVRAKILSWLGRS
jgi:hypothetical protein